uniref:Kinesin motor domain-containing protein n=1 Tax=Schistocephalus solidus TaxID=70667 RepID=A0A0X3Q5G9_SCHSO
MLMRPVDHGSHRRIIIAARVRPFTNRELQSPRNDLAVEIPQPGLIKCTKRTSGGDAPHVFFRVDHTFCSVSEDEGDRNLEQVEVYEKLGRRILMSALEGYNACLFAYGVTSSGKTYSMFGSPENPGIIPRLVEDLFAEVSHNQRPNCRTTVQLSFFEIYKEKLIDLLQPKSSTQPLAVREHPATGPFVEGLLEPVVRSPQEVFTLLRLGDSRRKVSSTAMNERSSRSHTIATLLITRREMAMCALKETVENVFTSKLNLVDLAGSERQPSSLTSSARLDESCHINKSLFTLGKVISQLSNEASGRFASHCRSTERGVYPLRVIATPVSAKATAFRTPQVDYGHTARSTTRQPYISYRDSVLTWILKESLGGNSVTTMLATLSPSSLHYEDTLSTLQYAKRAHSIVNTAVINEDPEGKIIRELMSEIDRLRQQAKQAHKPNSPLASQIKNLKALLRARECEVAFLSNELTRRTIESANLKSENRRFVDQLVGSKFGIPPPLPFQPSEIPLDASRTPLKALNASPLQLLTPRMSIPSRPWKDTDHGENSPGNSTCFCDRRAPDGQDATCASIGGTPSDEDVTVPATLEEFAVSTLVEGAHTDRIIEIALLPTPQKLKSNLVGVPSADQETQTEGQPPLELDSAAVSSEVKSATSKQLTEQGTNTSFVADAESPVAAIGDLDQEPRALVSHVAEFEGSKLVDVATCTADDGMSTILMETTEFLFIKDKLNSLVSTLASTQKELTLSDANNYLKSALIEVNESQSKQKKTLISCSTATLPSEIGFDVIALDRLAQLKSDLQNLRARLSVDRRDTATCTTVDDVQVMVPRVVLHADPERLSPDLTDSVHSHVLDFEENNLKRQHETLPAVAARTDPLSSLPPDVGAAAAVGARIDTASLQKLKDLHGVLSTLGSRLEAEEAVRRADRATSNQGLPVEEAITSTLMTKITTLSSQLAASARSTAQLRTELSNLRFHVEELEGEKEILQLETNSSRRLLDLTQKENLKLKAKYTKAVELLTKYLRESGKPSPSHLYSADV